VESAVVSNRHVAPTLAALAGAEMPGMGDGRMLLPGVQQTSTDRAVFQTETGTWRGTSYQSLYGIRRGDWMLHWADVEGGGELSLFNVVSDPLELHDLSSSEGTLAQELFRELRTQRTAQREWEPAHVIGVGAGGIEEVYSAGIIEREQAGEDGDGD
jgi:arylsulfatase A-like enzyme